MNQLAFSPAPSCTFTAPYPNSITMRQTPVAVISGVGPGIGFAVARAFAQQGYAVALSSRSKENMQKFADQLRSEGFEDVAPFCCDSTDQSQVKALFGDVSEHFKGPIEVVVFNAAGGLAFQSFEEVSTESLENSLNVNAKGAFFITQEGARSMLHNSDGDTGKGAILVTGATASIRGGAQFTAFASGMAARRSICQSAARSLGPKGIHVAHFVIDGGVGPAGGESYNRIHPESIAKVYAQVAVQDKSCWQFEVDMRTSIEKW